MTNPDRWFERLVAALLLATFISVAAFPIWLRAVQ